MDGLTLQGKPLRMTFWTLGSDFFAWETTFFTWDLTFCSETTIFDLWNPEKSQLFRAEDLFDVSDALRDVFRGDKDAYRRCHR